MRGLRVLRTAAGSALLGLAFVGRSLAADVSPPTIYKWVDENGIAHYTTNKKRIPRNLRNRIRSVDEVKREQEKAERAAAPSAAAAASAGTGAGTADAGSPDVESEALGDQTFREGPLGTEAAPGAEPEPPTPTFPPAGPAATAAAPVTPQLPPPSPPLSGTSVGGPASGTDIYAVRDAGDDRGTTAGLPDAAGGGDPLFEPEPSEGGSTDPNAAARVNEIDGLIAGLEAELAKDERRLKELISGARMEQGKPAPLYGVPELEELAHRFPKIQGEIAALRAERRTLGESR